MREHRETDKLAERWRRRGWKNARAQYREPMFPAIDALLFGKRLYLGGIVFPSGLHTAIYVRTGRFRHDRRTGEVL